MAKYKAIIFDVDGTLVDSNDAHAHAFVDAMYACGFPQATFEIVRPLIGMGGDKLLPRAVGVEKESEDGKKIGDKRGKIFKAQYQDAIKPFPGAKALTSRLKSDGFRLIVASSGEPEEVETTLQNAGVRSEIEIVVTGKDAPESKPHPMIIETALKKADITASDALMIGDTPYDVEAAKRAGVSVLAVRSGGWKNKDLQAADFVFADIADVLAHYEEVFG